MVLIKDENFWKENENKDFDAETADDWDLDMNVYYESNQADKDAIDLIDMRREEMLRRGDTSLIDDEQKQKRMNPFVDKQKNKKICAFFDKDSFGRRQMEKYGWKAGQSIGLRSGLIKALDANDAKKPMDKTGLGYRGEKVDREFLIKLRKDKEEKLKRNSEFYIGSIYDKNPNRPNTLLTRFEPTLKYK